MEEDAQHFLATGPTGLERYLPYWLASRLEWFIFVVLPLLVLVYPIVRTIPMLFEQYIRSRIFRWYSEIHRVEQQLPTYSIEQIDEKIEWLDALHEYLNDRLRLPIFYLSDYYQLRGTLSVAIQRFEKRRQYLQHKQEVAQINTANPSALQSTEYGEAGALSTASFPSSAQTNSPEPSTNGNVMPIAGTADGPPLPSPTKDDPEQKNPAP